MRGIWGFALVLPSPYLLSWDIFGPGEIPTAPPPPIVETMSLRKAESEPQGSVSSSLQKANLD